MWSINFLAFDGKVQKRRGQGALWVNEHSPDQVARDLGVRRE
jgi:hypothetical protein